MLTPTLKAERVLWNQGLTRVAGVDEVGMGCFGGPVVSAAVIVPVNARRIAGVRDSKTLSALQREALAPKIKKQVIAWGVGAASVQEIEDLNILHASRLAMCRALARLGGYDHALIDGRRILGLAFGPHSTIVDGDASSYAIASASILAKVARDRLMQKLAVRYPGYGWETNVGYSTRQHKEALRRLGPTPFHRRAYAPVIASRGELPDLEEALPPLGSFRERIELPPGFALPAAVTTLKGFEAHKLDSACAVELHCVLDSDGQLLAEDGSPALAATSGKMRCGGSSRLVDVLNQVGHGAAVHIYFQDLAAVQAFAGLVSRGLPTESSLVVGSDRLDVLAELRKSVPALPRAVWFEPSSRVAGMLVACRYAGAQFARLTTCPADDILAEALHRAGIRAISPWAPDASSARRFVALGLEFISVPDTTILENALTQQVPFSLEF